jgi:hypothetical protein
MFIKTRLSHDSIVVTSYRGGGKFMKKLLRNKVDEDIKVIFAI